MRQKIFALGQDFFIENEQGQKAFKVDGKVLRVRDTLKFKDMQGNTLCQIQQKFARIRDTMDIDGPDLKVQGNILDHEYKISDGNKKVAEVSKKWFRLCDTYGVEVAPGQNDVIILAVTVAVDMMAHAGRTNV